jgi:hypothetical protein
VRDITLHDEVIDVVMGLGTRGDTAESSNRIKRVAHWFKWED